VDSPISQALEHDDQSDQFPTSQSRGGPLESVKRIKCDFQNKSIKSQRTVSRENFGAFAWFIDFRVIRLLNDNGKRKACEAVRGLGLHIPTDNAGIIDVICRIH
jgi:hypothetical protein